MAIKKSDAIKKLLDSEVALCEKKFDAELEKYNGEPVRVEMGVISVEAQERLKKIYTDDEWSISFTHNDSGNVDVVIK